MYIYYFKKMDLDFSNNLKTIWKTKTDFDIHDEYDLLSGEILSIFNDSPKIKFLLKGKYIGIIFDFGNMIIFKKNHNLKIIRDFQEIQKIKKMFNICEITQKSDFANLLALENLENLLLRSLANKRRNKVEEFFALFFLFQEIKENKNRIDFIGFHKIIFKNYCIDIKIFPSGKMQICGIYNLQ